VIPELEVRDGEACALVEPEGPQVASLRHHHRTRNTTRPAPIERRVDQRQAQAPPLRGRRHRKQVDLPYRRIGPRDGDITGRTTVALDDQHRLGSAAAGILDPRRVEGITALGGKLAVEIEP